VGFGPNFQELAVTNSSGGTLSFIFGVGADFGFNYELSDTTFFNIGMMADYSFACFTFQNNDVYGWNKGNYSNVSLRPYVGMGVVMNRGK